MIVFIKKNQKEGRTGEFLSGDFARGQKGIESWYTENTVLKKYIVTYKFR